MLKYLSDFYNSIQYSIYWKGMNIFGGVRVAHLVSFGVFFFLYFLFFLFGFFLFGFFREEVDVGDFLSSGVCLYYLFCILFSALICHRFFYFNVNCISGLSLPFRLSLTFNLYIHSTKCIISWKVMPKILRRTL